MYLFFYILFFRLPRFARNDEGGIIFYILYSFEGLWISRIVIYQQFRHCEPIKFLGQSVANTAGICPSSVIARRNDEAIQN
jgi:hypothetical protein